MLVSTSAQRSSASRFCRKWSAIAGGRARLAPADAGLEEELPTSGVHPALMPAPGDFEGALELGVVLPAGPISAQPAAIDPAEEVVLDASCAAWCRRTMMRPTAWT
jgi:hypothetical protein